MEDLIVIILLVVLSMIAKGRKRPKKSKKPDITPIPKKEVIAQKSAPPLPVADAYSPVGEAVLASEESIGVEEKPNLLHARIKTRFPEKQTELKKIENKQKPQGDIDLSNVFDREGILKGIIVHEILSPPRALDNKRR